MKNKKTLREGFSLIELLIVIVILGGLIGVVAPGLMKTAGKAKRDTVCLKMKDLSKRLDMFKLDNGVYPDSDEGFQALITNPDSDRYPGYNPSGYLERIPKDSWKTPFTYVKQGRKFEIISFGADRREGGEDDGTDILLSVCNK